MTRPQAKSITLTKVSKAVGLPRHPLSRRLSRFLKTVDAVHTATNLKQVAVEMTPFVLGAVFDAYTGTGPYTIQLNPNGSHIELSLIHEVGHFLEWQAIPKSGLGQRSFKGDPLFAAWLQAIRESQNINRLLDLRDAEAKESSVQKTANYLLDEQELWARSYSQYIAVKMLSPMLLQQIAAENKVITGKIQFRPYWDAADFDAVQSEIDKILQPLGWLK